MDNNNHAFNAHGQAQYAQQNANQDQDPQSQFSGAYYPTGTPQNFDQSWSSGLVDPRLQQTNYNLNQAAYLGYSPHMSHNLPYNHTFNPSQQYYQYPDFSGGSPYPTYSPFAAPPLAYHQPHPQSIQSPILREQTSTPTSNGINGSQTIAPSVLDSRTSSDQKNGPQIPQTSQKPTTSIPQHQQVTSTLTNHTRLAPSPAPSLTGPAQVFNTVSAAEYVSGLPDGQQQGEFAVRDGTEVEKKVNASRFTGFVFVGNTQYSSSEASISLPRYTHRPSLRELQQQIIKGQGDAPWDLDAGRLLKKLKLSVPRNQTNGNDSVVVLDESSGDDSDADGSEDSDDEYESDDEPAPPPEPSPLPSARPAESGAAAEYDTIKALWAPSRSRPSAAEIKNSLKSFLDIVKEVYDSWKSENAKQQAAVEAKKSTEASKHKLNVNESRGRLLRVIRAATAYAHRDILDNFGSLAPLWSTLYTLLADRIKESDYGSAVLVDICNFMLRCWFIDKAFLTKTKLEKVLPKILKRGDAKTKPLAEKIVKSAEHPTRPDDAADEALRAVAMPRSAAKDKTAAANGPKSAASSAKAPIPGKPDTKGTSASAEPAKEQVKKIITKPSAYLSLLSASKRPGAAAAKPAVQNVAAPKQAPKDPAVAPPATPAPSFSFAAMMAGLNKPKEVEVSRTSTPESQVQETAAERKKRLRKEERRKLRVSFKEGAALTEIRLFHHDPEEELGHADNFIKDAGDTMSEGRMLKAHLELNIEDEEEYDPESLSNLEWYEPTKVDFEDIEPQEQARNTTSRGGLVEPESAESKLQDTRVNNTLLAFYSTFQDIPPSPREPSETAATSLAEPHHFGQPEQKFLDRASQSRHAGNPPNQQAPAPVTDLSSIFQRLAGNAAPPQAPFANNPLYNIPQQQQAQQAPAAPFAGLTPQLQSLLAGLAGSTTPASQQPQQQPPQQAPAPLQQPMNPMQIAMNFLNQNKNPAPAAPAPAPAPAPMPQANMTQLNALLASLGANAGQQASAPQPSNDYEDNSRKRGYDDDSRSREYDQGDSKRKKYMGFPVVPCKFWQEGRCRKGAECTFLHEN